MTEEENDGCKIFGEKERFTAANRWSFPAPKLAAVSSADQNYPGRMIVK